MSRIDVPMDLNYNFFITYVNHYNCFTYERVYPGKTYIHKPNSQLLFLPTFIPKFVERPLLYFFHLPKFF